MSPTALQIFDAAVALPQDERESLALLLFESLEGPPDEGVAEAWEAEIRRRIESSDRGEVTWLSHDEVWQRLKAKYGALADKVSS